MNVAYLSLGSNIAPEHNLRAAVALLAEAGRLIALSPAYETPPVGNPNDPPFLNAAAVLETSRSAEALKEGVLRPLEDRLGRRRSADPNAPRTIDVDISLFNDQVLQVGKRRIPDPEILRYPHVAVPLADVAPAYRHPETGETLAEIARRVRALSGQPLRRRDDVLTAFPRADARPAPLPEAILPLTARRTADGGLAIGGCDLEDLAGRFGTPLYVYDRATLDAAAAAYADALRRAYPGSWEVAYAAKAWLCPAVAAWAAARGLGMDVVSAGEIALARRGGFPPSRMHLHGNHKSPFDLLAALDAGVGRIVVDHREELRLVDRLARGRGLRQPIWLRVNPDVNVDTHGHVRTGHAASKFGLGLADGSAEAAAAEALQRSGVALVGLHCHIGSQLRDPAPLLAAVERLLDLAGRLRQATGWEPAELSPGGGWAVPYTPDQAVGMPSVDEYLGAVAQAVVEGCRRRGLALPRLIVEPGRSLVARAGVAVYTVGAVKRSGDVTYAFVDGGLADNPRPALYAATYTALLANRSGEGPLQTVRVAGPYCETGDVLIQAVDLPPLRPGDLLAVPVSGAYQLSMASNYNASLRPAVVWVEEGQPQLVQRRETLADLWARDAAAPA
ncbi:MAG: diaminopimelate decarboxylase [Caldilineales bacterium]|nr:diaminopimelate decarboxylase [Caldilineales bacterium]